MPDHLFGYYRLISPLDHRGHHFDDSDDSYAPSFGAYLAEHIHFKTQAIIKVLKIPKWLEGSSDVKDFLTGAQTLVRLEHPHIVRVFDFGVKNDNCLFLAMSHISNGTLRHRHPRGTKLPLTTIVSYAKQAADALQHAHDAKLIHYEIKPKNMLLGDNNAILLDFSPGLFGKLQLEIADTIMLTKDQIAYMSPEQHSGYPLIPAIDQYALGVTVYEWLCGTYPFNSSSWSWSSPPSLREKDPALTPTVEGVILTALAPDWHYRFANVQSFATALEKASLPASDVKVANHSGKQLGHYRLIQLLGRGGFADVYLAEHMYLETQVALKVLQTRLTDEDLKELFTEAQIVARLEHPHIVRVFDCGVDDEGRPFLAMGYASNGTLRQRHPKGVRLPLATIVCYVKEVADALQYAHDAKIIHRDVKPENMLLGRNNEVLLSDFGIAVVAHSTLSWEIQKVSGTPIYMAPEQFLGQAKTASDQYALGVVVYEWLCGTPPFSGGFAQLGYQHTHVPPPSLRKSVPTIPPAVEQVVLAVLAKDTRQRFTSVRAFALSLERAYQPSVRGTILHTYRGHSNLMRTTGPYRSSEVLAVAWSPDGRCIASGGKDNTVQVWGADDGYHIYTYRGHSSSINSVAWSPEGTQIASASDDGTVQIWDAIDGGNVFTYRGHTPSVSDVVWSLDGTRLASAGSQTVQIWDIATGKEIYSYRGHSFYVHDIAWSPNGKYIASVGNDQTVQVWDTTTGQCLYTHGTSRYAVAWSPDNIHLAWADDKMVQVWNIATGKEIYSYCGDPDSVNDIAWSPDGKRIASAGDRTVQVWDATTGQHLYTHRKEFSGRGLTWSPDGTRLASAGNDAVQIWQAI